MNTLNDNGARLKGNMGTFALVTTVLAFSAPLSTASGFLTVLIGYGDTGAPLYFVLCIAIFLFFAVGFCKMGAVMQRPGGFYAYITDGLGKKVGLVSAFVAAAGYILNGLNLPCFFSLTFQNFIKNLGGPELPWWIIGIVTVIVTTFLASRSIDFSAKVLVVAMTLEVIVLVAFDIGCFVKGAPAGSGGFVLSGIDPKMIGLGLMFSVCTFFGFEATVIYREECRKPEKTIPRATIIAIVFIGVFYGIATMAFVAHYGANDVMAKASADPSGLFYTAIMDLFGKIVLDCVNVIALFSIFASCLSVQNIATRYLYSMGVDGVIPKKLGVVNPKYNSPSNAAIAIGIFWAICMVIFRISGKPADFLYPMFSGLGTIFIMMVICMCAVAVPVYFKKHPEYGFGKFSTVIAPILGIIGVGFVTVMMALKVGDLLGTTSVVTAIFCIIAIIYIIVTYMYALHIEKKKPDVYAKIGRMDV